jgi:hypothetical protein
MRKEEYNLNGHNKIRKRKNNSQNLKKFKKKEEEKKWGSAGEELNRR